MERESYEFLIMKKINSKNNFWISNNKRPQNSEGISWKDSLKIDGLALGIMVKVQEYNFLAGKISGSEKNSEGEKISNTTL